MEKNNEIISSIDRALDIILLFYTQKKELGIGEISRLLNMPKSTVHRVLATMERKGFVSQLEENGKYWLGVRLYSIGMVTWEHNKLNQIVQPYAIELSARFGETVSVSILDNRSHIPSTMVVFKEESATNRLRTSHEIGGSYPIHTTAVGKAILAFSEAGVIERIKQVELVKNTEHTIGSIGQLLSELEQIRARGYSLDNEEEEVGLKCIAAPVFDSYGKVVAAISLSGPAGRMDLLDQESTAKDIIQTAAKITQRLK